MHKTQPGGELPSIDVHFLVQEDEVHLEEDEHQLKTGAQEPKRIITSSLVAVVSGATWTWS